VVGAGEDEGRINGIVGEPMPSALL